MQLKDLENRKDVGLLLNALGLTGFGLEIGVAYGENAEFILEQWAGHGLFLVDPWKTWEEGEYVDGSSKIDFDGAFNHCMDRLKRFPCRTVALRMLSDEALDLFPDNYLDFVYVDGNHHLPQVKKDVEQWYKKVKPGGLFGGHDYYNRHDEGVYICDVEKTVNTFVEENKLEDNFHTTTTDPLDFSWWIQKPKSDQPITKY